ncbi:Predicted DNA-binding protein, MmcQ/YjbR family [Lentzea waywayandensis]|uniref:Predicted DNA-binding protein, MmcQ/YjbR family n=1 Tax=Lentzea waywayandensis TaxID=84724 RepID=A0A1I6EX78_9PSEU|nr:MmcQ/YjbR family DNA-binding protein [Lentzea waywayandensis]SFR22172.1 Predicted DNA-binding protein, MmcQ/YjbR family [Lentzea waywayandensis]
MNGSILQKTAADCAEELPGARLEHPFGPDWEVFKVRGKVFMLMTEIPGRPVVILKADPGEALALLEHNSHITPGYHMNKKHWITLEGGEGVTEEFVRELVTDSYRLVVAHLPKAEQPVDPHTYGSATRAAR